MSRLWQFTVMRQGWCSLEPKPGGFTVLVRFVAREDGRLEATELYVQSLQGLSGGLLSELSIGRIEATANLPGHREELLHEIEAAGVSDEPDRADVFLASVTPPQDPTESKVLASPFFSDPMRVAHRRRVLADLKRRGSLSELKKRFSAHKGKRRRPDAFYRAVGDAYRVRASGSRRPAAEIAGGLGVPVGTVHQWVKEARRRGFLPPGRSGKAG